MSLPARPLSPTRLAAAPAARRRRDGHAAVLARHPPARLPRRARHDPAGPRRRASTASTSTPAPTSSRPLTFGANRLRLDAYGLADRGRPPQPPRGAGRPRGARRQRPRRVVGGIIGPLGAPTRELRHPDEAAIRAAFREQIDGLLEGGVDLLVIETFFDLDAPAARRRRGPPALRDLPIVASMTFGEDLVAGRRHDARGRGAALAAAGVDAIGVNCGVGPAGLPRRAGADRRPDAGEPARSIMPNAGLPQRIEGQFVYAAGPAYFGAMVPRLARRGGADRRRLLRHDARSTSPRCAPRSTARRRRPARTAPATAAVAPPPARRPPHRPRRDGARRDRRSERAAADRASRRALAEGRFVDLGRDRPAALASASSARSRPPGCSQDAGVDLVNISDSAMARVRMGALAVAFGIQHDLDLECLVHFTTRDRNLMALESELLGAHALGVRNILALTGDPPRIGDYPTGHRRLGRRFDRPRSRSSRASTGARTRPARPIGQPAGVHDRLRARPDRRRRRRPSGTASSASSPPAPTCHDPAAVRRGAGRGDARRGAAPLRAGRLPGPGAARRAAAPVAPATPSSCTTRCPGITIPDATRAAHARRRRPRRRGRASRWPTRCSRRSASEVAGHLHDAQLRPLRAGGGAGPPDPRAPPDARRPAGLVTTPRTHGFAVAPAALAVAARVDRSSRCSASSPRRRRGRAAVPAAGRGPGRLRHRRGLPAGNGRAGRGDDRRHRAADRRRDRGLHAARRPAARPPMRRSATPGALMDQWGVGRAGLRRRPRHPVRPPRGRPRATARCSCTPAPATPPSSCRTRSARRSSTTTCCRCSARATSTARCWPRCSKVDAAATPEHAAQLNFFRLLNAALGLLGRAARLFVLIVGGALVAWFRHGRDPVYLDDPSIHIPAPPAGLTPAAGAVIRDGKSTRRALTTAQPRPRRPRPDRVRRRAGGPPRSDHRALDPHPGGGHRRPGRDGAAQPGARPAARRRHLVPAPAPALDRRRVRGDRRQGAAEAGHGRRRLRQAARGARRRPGLVHRDARQGDRPLGPARGAGDHRRGDRPVHRVQPAVGRARRPRRGPRSAPGS